ncbi:MAG: FeoB-associated Cys-rich membrane protein [Nibricoccus sp.]
MFDNWQTPIAILVVLLALAALVRGAISKKKKPGCGGGCCPTDKFKAGLKH